MTSKIFENIQRRQKRQDVAIKIFQVAHDVLREAFIDYFHRPILTFLEFLIFAREERFFNSYGYVGGYQAASNCLQYDLLSKICREAKFPCSNKIEYQL